MRKPFPLQAALAIQLEATRPDGESRRKRAVSALEDAAETLDRVARALRPDPDELDACWE